MWIPQGWENRRMNDWSSWYNVNVSVMLNSPIVQSLVMHFWVSAQGHVYTTLEGSIFLLYVHRLCQARDSIIWNTSTTYGPEAAREVTKPHFLHPEHQLYVDALTFATFLHLFISRNRQYIMHSPTEDVRSHKQRQTKKTYKVVIILGPNAFGFKIVSVVWLSSKT